MIGDRISFLRLLRRMKQAELARLVNISTSRLSRLENNHLKPAFHEVELMAKALQCNLEDFAEPGPHGHTVQVTFYSKPLPTPMGPEPPRAEP